MDSIKKMKQFFSYWYVRYLLATELYIVETWEKNVVHLLIVVLFGLVWCFNYFVLLNSIAQLRDTKHDVVFIPRTQYADH